VCACTCVFSRKRGDKDGQKKIMKYCGELG
jgi:hypothetical protein